MEPVICQECGHQVADDATACTHCGGEAKNGAVPHAKRQTQQAAVPTEAQDWISYKVPQEILVWARDTYTEEETLAALREVEQNGGVELKDFIHELEAGASPRE